MIKRYSINLSKLAACVVVFGVSGCGDESRESKLTNEAESRLALLGKEVVVKKAVVEEVVTEANDAQSDEAGAKVAQEVIDKAIVAGKTAYTNCMACHQANGAGIPGVFPPLAKSDWVNTLSNEELSAIVIRGLQGEISVNGTPYAQMMAPLGALMNDQQIADVLTYVKNTWENEGGYVSPEEVKTVRAESEGKPPLTASDIKGLENL